MTHVAVLHVLTPGSPAYAVAKLSAIGGLVALRFVITRRGRTKPEPSSEHEGPAAARRPAAHPVSAKKKRRRRRG